MLISRKLGGFLVYNFMKSWDGVRLPLINTVSTLSTKYGRQSTEGGAHGGRLSVGCA